MKRGHLLPAIITASAAVASMILIISCSNLQRAGWTQLVAPRIEGATFVGNKACAECHAEFTRIFASSPHARVHIGGTPRADVTGCESCHGPGSLHVDAGGAFRNDNGARRALIINPGREPDICLNCHIETHAQFKLPHHHPVLEHRMNCVQCHDPHGTDILKASHRTAFGARAQTGLARLNETCAQCHREQARAVVYEHEALREGCTICHQPHGSIADKMLVQRDNNLCLKCHAQVHTVGGGIFIGDVPHTTFVNKGACWSAGCHTAIHGSNIDRALRY